MEIRVNDGAVYYEELNPRAKRVLVVLHGWGHSSALWKDWAEKLSKDYRIIIPDLPLFGRSSPLPNNPDLADYSSWFKDFLVKLNLKTVDLLGHSFGGQLAAKIVLDNPLLVNKLILVAPAIVRQKQGFIKLKTNFLKTLGVVKRLIPLGWRYQLASSLDYAQASRKQKDLLVNLLKTDLVKSINKIDKSTLIVWGEKEVEILGNGKALMRLMANSRLKVLYGAMHNLQVESPELLRQTVERFLE